MRPYLITLSKYFIIVIMMFFLNKLIAQEGGMEARGYLREAGSGKPISGAIVSLPSTGELLVVDEKGAFSLTLSAPFTRILIQLPGYHSLETYIAASEELTIFLHPEILSSSQELFNNSLGVSKISSSTVPVSFLAKGALEGTSANSFDHALQGRVPGLNVIRHSGMPGQRAWISLRGLSSLVARNEPLLIIDGMVHETRYANVGIISGQSLNPMDIIDSDDIIDISVIRQGESNLGAMGSNGIIFVNTEEKKETSASIVLRMYGGLSLAPQSLNVMEANDFRTYFSSRLADEFGYTQSDIDNQFPWLNGGIDAPEYYRYNNNTDWQKKNFRSSSMQKYHIFLKGGDDIATYNISTGLLRHGGPYESWGYWRYNLRLNGKVNLTNKLSITPNAKVSLSNTQVSNMGPISERNPVLANLLMSPLMTDYALDQSTGKKLNYIDEEGVFGLSNPSALIQNSTGETRNYHFLSSVNTTYAFTPNLSLSNFTGISFNNARDNIFIPDIGVVQIDSARNSPMSMVNEFRSTQNNTSIKYSNVFNDLHAISVNTGLRYLNNKYKRNVAIDLNTPSDDYTALGKGGSLTYLREATGEERELVWVAYYTTANYSYQDKYLAGASFTVDASSVTAAGKRYNFYPSFSGAWRLSSENFMRNIRLINDLKLRASYGKSGNMYSDAYDFSTQKLGNRRYGNSGSVVFDYIANPEMEIETKTTVNAGFDLYLLRNSINLHVDAYQSNVNNLLIYQPLEYVIGFADYYNNGGALQVQGLEIAAGTRFYLGEAVLMLNATIAKEQGKITSLNFIDANTTQLVTSVYGANFLSKVGSPMNMFYGYKTKGIYNDAPGIIGPNRLPLQPGDVIFDDFYPDNVIDLRDMQVIGDPNPDFFGSFSAGVLFKRFKFSSLFTYSIGNDAFNYVRFKMTAMDSYANQSPEVLNRWRADNHNSSLPRAAFGDPVGNNVFSDRWIEDASYLRLRELTVSYLVKEFLGLRKDMTVYLTGANLLTFTKYTGYDPEFMYMNSPFLMGIDFGKVPSLRSVIIGLKLDL